MPISEALTRLATAFTVRDVMVTTKDLVRARVRSKAASVSKEYPDFSVIPIGSSNTLSAYYSRDSGRTGPIKVKELIGDGTGVFDLVDILENRQFAFVLGPRQIDGYVHFSDLNHHLVKLAFYFLLERVECFALDSVRPELNEEFMKTSLGAARFEQVQRLYERAGDAGQSTSNYLNIADILKLAKKAGTIAIDETLIQGIRRVRNGAAHSSENLVSSYSDVKTLAQVKMQCLQILRMA